MNRSSVLLLAGLLLLGLTPRARGQEDQPNAAELKQQLDEQQKQLDAMSKKLEGLGGGEPSATEAAAAADAADDEAAEDDWTKKIKLGMFYIESADGNYRLDIRARLQVDSRVVLNRRDYDDTFQVRRARIEFRGHLHKRVKFDIGLEFGRTSDADLRNAFMEIEFCKEFSLRAGQFLLPYSDQRLNSSKYLNHPERSILVANIVGQRDFGLQVHGTIADVFHYAIAVVDGEGQNKKVDTDDDPDTVARVVFTPFGDWNLSFSLNYIYTPTNRNHTGPTNMHTVGNEFSQFLTYDTANNVAKGRRQRVGGGFKFSTGPFEIKGELNGDYHREVANSVTGREDNLLNWEYFLDVTYVLTGETIKQKVDGGRVKPESPLYDPETKTFGMGAFQVSMRFEELFVDPSTIKRGYAIGVDHVRSLSTTAHWYMFENVRFSMNYTFSHFDSDAYIDSGGHRHVDDHALLGRLAFFF